MADEVKKLPTIASPRLDGFGGFSDEVEGGEEQVSGRGPPLKFSNEAEWLYNEEALPADLELLAVNVERIVVYWEDEQPNRDKTQTLGPKEPWPDVATLNDATPRDQWREGPDGHLHGPYQRQYVVHFLSMKDMARYWWPTATVGGGICVRDGCAPMLASTCRRPNGSKRSARLQLSLTRTATSIHSTRCANGADFQAKMTHYCVKAARR